MVELPDDFWDKIEQAQKEPFLNRSNDDGLRDFYRNYFLDEEELENFLKSAASQIKTRQMVWLTKWLIDIADGQEQIFPSRNGLKILFLIILAESIAKMADNYIEEGKSRDYVEKFFGNANKIDSEVLLNKIHYTDFLNQEKLTIIKISRFFYSIRCDIAHQGLFWKFHFHTKSNIHQDTNYDNTDIDLGTISFKSSEFNLSILLTYDEFKNFIVKTSVKHVQEYNQNISRGEK